MKTDYGFRALAATVALLSLAGCGGSGGGSGRVEPGTSTYTGVAMDGYLRGATVCLDIDDDLACDAGEPSTVTDASGRFTLRVAQGIAGRVVVEVGPDTIDADTGRAVGRRYTLTAPAGHHAVITPLTTLVHLQQALDESPLDEAQTEVGLRLGITSGLMSDYIAGGDQRAHAVAQVAATVLAEKLEAIRSLDSGISFKDALLLAVSETDLAVLGTAADDPAYRTDGALDPAKIAASDLAKLGANAGSVKDFVAERARAALFADAKPMNATEIMDDGHADQLTFLDDRAGVGRDHFDGKGGFKVNDGYAWLGGAWVADAASATAVVERIMLDDTGRWKRVGDFWRGEVDADGAVRLTEASSATPQTIRYRGLDLAGKRIADWIPASWMGRARLRLKDADARFPAGSKALKMTWAGVDDYIVVPHFRIDRPSFEALVQQIPGNTEKLPLRLNQGLKIVFAPVPAGATSGAVDFYGDPNDAFKGKGSWSMETVGQEKILAVRHPASLNANAEMLSSAFFVQFEGRIYQGLRYLKHTAVDSAQRYNRIASDAIAAALEKDVGPTAGWLRVHYHPYGNPSWDLGFATSEGWAENPVQGPATGRSMFATRDDWGSVGDFAVAPGAAAVKFNVLAGSYKICGTGLSYTLPADFASTRFAEIWIKDCIVSSSYVPAEAGYIEVFLKRPADGSTPDWGLWSLEGTKELSASPSGQAYPAGRTLLTSSNVSGWVSAKMQVKHDQLGGKLRFRIVDPAGRASCPQDLSFDYGLRMPALSSVDGYPIWAIKVDGCTIAAGQPAP